MAAGADKYRAFLSYSHKDTAWGDWIHAALENYRVPRGFAGRSTNLGPVPSNLRPIFRDRTDLSASHSLDERISSALRNATHLIVICSPDAVKSRSVNEEIRQFKALGKSDRILALIVGGEPHDSERECFPRSLLNKVDALGQVTDERDTEPIAADARPDGDGRELAKLKLVGGLLGVDLDEIRQRDLAEQKRQKRIWRGVAAVMSLLAVAAAAFAVFWSQEYEEKAALLEKTRGHLERSLEKAAAIVEKAARTNDEYGVPVHVVDDFMADAQTFISEAEGMLLQVERHGLGDIKVDLRRAQGRALLNFARTAAKMPDGVRKDQSAKHVSAEQLAQAARKVLEDLVKVEGEPLDTYHDLSEAELEIADARLLEGKLDVALDLYEAACARKEWIIRVMDPSNRLAWRRELGRCYCSVGTAHVRRQSVAPALAAIGQAMVEFQSLLEEKPDDEQTAFYAMNCLRLKIDALRSEGEVEAAMATAEQATGIGERVAVRNPGAVKVRRGMAYIMLELGDVLVQIGQHQRALEKYEPAKAIFEQGTLSDPKNAKLRNSYAWSLVNVGSARLQLGNSLEAWRAFARARQIYRQLVIQQPKSARLKYTYGGALDGVAEVYARRGHFDAAMAVRERQVAIFESAGLQPNIAQVQIEIGGLHMRARSHREALSVFEVALSTRRDLLAQEPEEAGKRNAVADALERVGVAHQELGNLSEAHAALAENLTIREQLFEEKPAIADRRAALGEGDLRLGLVADQMGRTAEARCHLSRSMELLGKAIEERPRASWVQSLETARSALGRAGPDIGVGTAEAPALPRCGPTVFPR